MGFPHRTLADTAAQPLLSVGHCLRSRNYVNVIVAGKQPAPNWLSMDAAIRHCTQGLGVWDWASTDGGGEPDVVLASAGDVPTLETLAAAELLREHLPDLRVRVINVVDLMRLQDEREHPHGLTDAEFDALFTADRPIVFAYHGYPWLIHRLTYRRANHGNLHVRGYKEEGTTTTPLSSTLKASVVATGVLGAAPPPAAAVTIEWGADATRSADVDAGVAEALGQVGLDGGGRPAAARGDLAAVAHRVVHGGPTFTAPILVVDEVLGAIDAFAPLAPLHNPIAAATIRAARRRLEVIPQVAVFDTAFHATLAESGRRYPLPATWDQWGIRRYGFHGLSVAWSVERAAQLLQRPVGELGLVVAHLGSGCSVTAVLAGRSVATSMGMTPLEGLMMGTRAGSIDPGIILAVLRDGRLNTDELAEILDHGAGLLGVSGSSSDMRELQAAADGGDERASLAIEMFVERAAVGVAAAATALPRLDGIVFTGGIGEHAGRVRAAIVERLAVLDVEPIDTEESGADRILGSRRMAPAVLRVEAREDIVTARAALAAIS